MGVIRNKSGSTHLNAMLITSRITQALQPPLFLLVLWALRLARIPTSTVSTTDLHRMTDVVSARLDSPAVTLPSVLVAETPAGAYILGM